MKKSIVLSVCTAIALCTVSCTRDLLKAYDPSATPFGQMVNGVIDPEQTYNLSSIGSVYVTLPSSGLVAVYTSNGKDAKKKVAEQFVTGSAKIEFDKAPDVKSLMVVNMATDEFRNVELGGTADFSAAQTSSTRTTYEGNSGKFNITLLGQGNGEYLKSNYAQLRSDVATDGFTDIRNAVGMFYTKNGSFTLYPVWYGSESGNSVTVGIYYYVNDHMVKVPVFMNDKSVPEAMMKFYTKGSQMWKVMEDAHSRSIATSDIDNDLKDNVMSRGIRVTCPAKTLFGFYIEKGNDQDVCFYSEGRLSEYPEYCKNQASVTVGDEVGKYGHVGVINVEGRKYLGFDDWMELWNTHIYSGVAKPEFSHLVFHFEGLLYDTDIVDEEEEPAEDDESGKISDQDGSWILACEDLGENADYDFNDVVLRITHMAGSTEAEVTLLAAGSTLADYIYFGAQNLGEVHELFGDTLVRKQTNTFYQLEAKPAVVVAKVAVPADFTMSAENMGGFQIRRGNVNGIVAAPEKGNVPYMICIPGTWSWPLELKSIVTAYPSFEGWCNDHTTNQDWYTKPEVEYIYNK